MDDKPCQWDLYTMIYAYEVPQPAKGFVVYDNSTELAEGSIRRFENEAAYRHALETEPHFGIEVDDHALIKVSYNCVRKYYPDPIFDKTGYATSLKRQSYPLNLDDIAPDCVERARRHNEALRY